MAVAKNGHTCPDDASGGADASDADAPSVVLIEQMAR
jgi:hypothetical protein